MTDDISKVKPAPNWCPACGQRPDALTFCAHPFHRLESATTPAEVDDGHSAFYNLRELTECCCHEDYKSRGRIDPDCNHLYREDVDTLARQLAEAKEQVESLTTANELLTASVESRGARYQQAESQLAEATRRLGEVERSARVNESLERAAKELPSGWLVTVIVEKHAGWVELTDPHGNTDPIDDDEGSLATAVHTAIDIALTKEPTK